MKRMFFFPVVLLMLQSGLVWSESEILDSDGDVGMYASAKIRAQGVAYYDASNGDLKYYKFAGETTNVLASVGDVGKYCSTAVWFGEDLNGDEYDMVGVSYYDETRGDLMFVSGVFGEFGDIAWNTPVEVDTNGNVGLYTSLSCYPVGFGGEGLLDIGAIPIISYYDQGNGDLMFVRALDVNGTTWDTPVRIAEAGDVGKYSSLMGWGNWFSWFFWGGLFMEENPPHPLLWLAYYDETNGDLMYVYDSTGNGTSWSAPIMVDTDGNVGQYASIMVVSTNPAISYYDETAGDLKYVRAQNENGTAWSTPVRVDTNGNVGLYSSLSLVYKEPDTLVPEIAYYDQTAGDLKTVTAKDFDRAENFFFWLPAYGRFWNPPFVRDSAGDVGRFASLLMLQDGMFYYDASNGDLKMAYDQVNYAYVLGTDGTPITNAEPASVQKGTDFGDLLVGNSVVHTLAITNEGPDAMEVVGIVTNGNGAALFRVTGVPHFVQGNTVSNFDLRYSPVSAGTHTAELIFVTSGIWGDDSFVEVQGHAHDAGLPEPPPPVASKADFQVRWVGTAPAAPKCKSSFTVKVLVQNKGTQKADAGHVQLTVNGVVIGTVKVGSLDKKRIKLVQFTGVRNPTGAKPIKITAKVDCNNVTGETNEGNNTRTISVKCR